jgi:uncharacterized protein (DUF433 family)
MYTQTVKALISVDPDALGGCPVFKGTCVLVESLEWHLEKGASLDDFLSDVPSVSRAQAAVCSSWWEVSSAPNGSTSSMKLLLDENLPKRLKALLAPHEAFTVRDMGWQKQRRTAAIDAGAWVRCPAHLR